MSKKRTRSESLDNSTVPEENLDFKINNLKDLIKLANDFQILPKKKKRKPEYNDLYYLVDCLPALIKLDNTIGMDDLKKEIVDQIVYFIQDLGECHMMHTVLMGNPGSGKTTLVNILTDLYRNLGCLKRGQVVHARRDELIGQYLGETAIKTKKVLDSARGGVLLIDEAYSLGSTRTTGDSYSKECIDTINQYLSEHANEFICIIAGYKDSLQKCFFDHNAGLSRRFPWRYEIKDYSDEDLFKIFKYQLNEFDSKYASWEIDKEAESLLKEFLKKEKEIFKGNGGDTKTLMEKSKMSHGKRIFGSKNPKKYVLNAEDIKEGFNKFKSAKDLGKEKAKIPFGMYI